MTTQMLPAIDRDLQWTNRQREVLDLLARGKTNPEIAEALGVSLAGAKWHVSEVMSKLGVTSRDDAANYWVAHNRLPRRLERALRASLGGLGLKWATLGATTVVGVGVLATMAMVAIVAGQRDDAPGGTVTSGASTADVERPPTDSSSADLTVPAGATAGGLRDSLKICVEVEPSLDLDADAVAQEVGAVVSAVIQSPAGIAADLDHFQADVISGCPHGYVPPHPEVGRDPALPPVYRGVAEPLEVSTLIFVVSEVEAQYLDPYGGIGRRDYESMCEQQTCAGVTTAVYVTSQTVQSEPDLVRAVLVGLGLSSLSGNP
jgi:DNA-binding CsgD family transcriptional regulator